MKVLFAVTGIGLGHVIREEAIINELKKRERDAEILVMGFGTSFNYFKDKFKTYRIIGHRLSGDVCKTSSFKMIMENLLYFFVFFIDFFSVLFRLLFIRPDLVVVDADPVVVYASKVACRKIVYIWNYDLNEVKFIKKKVSIQRGGVWLFVKTCYLFSNKVIIPVLLQKERVEGKVNYIGKIIRPYSKLSKKDLMKKLKLKKEPLIVGIGGSEFGKEFVEEILRVADEFKEDFIVFGLDWKNKKNVRFFKFKENFLDYLKVSKGVICLAGHNTLSEALAFGKPILVFHIKGLIEHEQNIDIIKDFVMEGKICNDFKELLKNYLNNLSLLRSKAKKLNLNGNGTKEAVDIILSLK